MPVAHISHSMIAQQLFTQSQLSQMGPMQSLGNSLAQYQGNSLGDMLQQREPTEAELEAARAMRIAYWERQARSSAEEGEDLVERIAFWTAFGLLAAPILKRLTDKLESIGDRIEECTAQVAHG